MSIIDNLKTAGQRMAELKEEITAQAQRELAPGLIQFLKDHPEIKALGWTQFTPYFNDGDPCVFCLSELHVSLEDERDTSLHEAGWQFLYELREHPYYTDLTKLEAALQTNDETLQVVFGDHVQVTVDEHGVHVDEYEHD